MDEKLQLTQLSQLAVFNGMMEAEIIKSKLESFEIPCMLKFEAVGRVLGLTADGLGKVQVMVPTEYIEKAMEIIRIDKSSNKNKNIDDNDYEEDDDDDDDYDDDDDFDDDDDDDDNDDDDDDDDDDFDLDDDNDDDDDDDYDDYDDDDDDDDDDK